MNATDKNEAILTGDSVLELLIFFHELASSVPVVVGDHVLTKPRWERIRVDRVCYFIRGFISQIIIIKPFHDQMLLQNRETIQNITYLLLYCNLL